MRRRNLHEVLVWVLYPVWIKAFEFILVLLDPLHFNCWHVLIAVFSPRHRLLLVEIVQIRFRLWFLTTDSDLLPNLLCGSVLLWSLSWLLTIILRLHALESIFVLLDSNVPEIHLITYFGLFVLVTSPPSAVPSLFAFNWSPAHLRWSSAVVLLLLYFFLRAWQVVSFRSTIYTIITICENMWGINFRFCLRIVKQILYLVVILAVGALFCADVNNGHN